MLFSITLLPPAGLALLYEDGTWPAFLSAFFITVFCGLALWLPTHKDKADLRTRDGFLIVALFWTVLGLFGSIPFSCQKGCKCHLQTLYLNPFLG